MYVSDYMYAASPTYWTLVGYSDSPKDYRAAVNDNWMYMGLYEWTIAPRADLSYPVFYVNIVGYVYDIPAFYAYAVRPVLALESSITYAGGLGTQDSPIIIN